jgi:hypothetical protein
MTQPLSPAAQVVFDAAEKAYWCPGVDYQADLMAIGAAAIRALVEQTLPEEPESPCGDTEPWPGTYQAMSDAAWEQRQRLRAQQLAVAAELEGVG